MLLYKCRIAVWYLGDYLFSETKIFIVSCMFPNACWCSVRCAYLEVWVLHRKDLLYSLNLVLKSRPKGLVQLVVFFYFLRVSCLRSGKIPPTP